jgi:hypothetical protein
MRDFPALKFAAVFVWLDGREQRSLPDHVESDHRKKNGAARPRFLAYFGCLKIDCSVASSTTDSLEVRR